MPPVRCGGGTRAADDAVGDGGALALAPRGSVLERSEPSHRRYSFSRVRPRGLGDESAPSPPARRYLGVRSGGHVMRAVVLRVRSAGPEASAAEVLVPARRRIGRERGRGCHNGDGSAGSAPSGEEE